MDNKLKNILKISVFSGFVIIVLVLTSGFGSVSASSVSGSDKSLLLVNELRKSKKLAPLTWNDKLAKAAQDKAVDMDRVDYFDHQSPEGRNAWDFVASEGYSYKKAGENLAINFSSVDDAMIAWEKSPSHLENMLSPTYTEFGYAKLKVNIEGYPTSVYVQIFGTPESVYDRALNDLIGN
jgi:uncharacterized protein YkwD